MLKIQNYETPNFLFSEYLDFVQNLCCNSCHTGKQSHHGGGLSFLLGQSPKISKPNFDLWVSDLKHGFFHGLLRGFWNFVYLRNIYGSHHLHNAICKRSKIKTINIETIFYSCFFSDLKNETITPNNNQVLINDFSETLMPCLMEIFSNLDKLWISHVSEHSYADNFQVHRTYYPEVYWQPYDEQMGLCEKTENCFSVNLDFLPLNKCHSHCIDSHAIIGLITKDKLNRLGNQIINYPPSTNGRDHPFVIANNKMHIDNWLFVFLNIEELKIINSRKSIHIENVNKFYNVCKLLIGRIEGFKVC